MDRRDQLLRAIRRAEQREVQQNVPVPPQHSKNRDHQQTINASRKINDLVNLIKGPASGAIQSLVDGEQQQQQLIELLKQISSTTASPSRVQRTRPTSPRRPKRPQSSGKRAGEETIEELASMLIEAGIDTYM